MTHNSGIKATIEQLFFFRVGSLHKPRFTDKVFTFSDPLPNKARSPLPVCIAETLSFAAGRKQ